MVCPNIETFYNHVLLMLLLNIFTIHPSKLLVSHHYPLAYGHFLQQDKWFLKSTYNLRTSTPPLPNPPIKVPTQYFMKKTHIFYALCGVLHPCLRVYLHAGNGTRDRNLEDSGLTKWDNGTEKCKGWRRWDRSKMRGVDLYRVRH